MPKRPKPTKPMKEVIGPRQESLRAEFAAAAGLPEPAYGEVRLWITARDARTLFTYWVFDPTEHPETRGEDGVSRFFLRIMRDDGGVETTVEIQPEAENWFVPVSQPDCEYFAEVGFFSKGVWCFLGRSGNARTPGEVPAEGDAVQFATIPAKTSLGEIRDLLASSALPGEGTAETVARVQAAAMQGDSWSAEQERLLAATLAGENGGAGANSADLTRRIKDRLAVAREEAVQTEEVPVAWEAPGVGSPGASWVAAPGRRDFFLHVNAELIFYGGTDPAATVTVNGEAVALRHDGTFRFHFRLPDGEFEIPIVARSPDGKELRSATLRFSRATARAGEVGATAQPDFLPGMIGARR
jgi:hypothetical protein